MKLLIFALVLLMGANLIEREPVTHICSYELCPYNGLDNNTATLKAAAIYGDGSDSYCIDMLHLEYPAYDYEKLDSLLFTPKN